MAVSESCKADLSNCERITSADQTVSALEEAKVRLPFFMIPCISVSQKNATLGSQALLPHV